MIKSSQNWLWKALQIVILAFVGFVVGYWWWLNPGYEAVAFTPERWMIADAENRGYMMEDLLATHEMSGLKSEEVIALLGKPDRSTVSELGDPEHLTYDVGYLGFRKGAPFVFSYELHILLIDAQVTRTYYSD
jgi:hypothetical protein